MGRQTRETQAMILAAAKAEFLEKGFQRASLRSMVQAAGVTTGALYGYYSSKEALFNSFVQDVYRYIVTQFTDTLSAFKNLPMQEQRKSSAHSAAPACRTCLAICMRILRSFACCFSAPRERSMPI